MSVYVFEKNSIFNYTELKRRQSDEKIEYREREMVK